MILNAEAPQPCINCGTIVAIFEQWFTEDCPGHAEGHQVADWPALEFTQALEAGPEEAGDIRMVADGC